MGASGGAVPAGGAVLVIFTEAAASGVGRTGFPLQASVNVKSVQASTVVMKAFVQVIVGTTGNEGVYGRRADKHASVFPDTSTTTEVPGGERDRLSVPSVVLQRRLLAKTRVLVAADRRERIQATGEWPVRWLSGQ